MCCYICVMQDYVIAAIEESKTTIKALRRAEAEEQEAQWDLDHNHCSYEYWERKNITKTNAEHESFRAASNLSNALERAVDEELEAED